MIKDNLNNLPKIFDVSRNLKVKEGGRTKSNIPNLAHFLILNEDPLNYFTH
jgi:hypothetical protein